MFTTGPARCIILDFTTLFMLISGTMGRAAGGGMSSMMDEMQKTLARRRAKVDRGSEEPEDGRDKSASPGKVGSAKQGACKVKYT